MGSVWEFGGDANNWDDIALYPRNMWYHLVSAGFDLILYTVLSSDLEAYLRIWEALNLRQNLNQTKM